MPTKESVEEVGSVTKDLLSSDVGRRRALLCEERLKDYRIVQDHFHLPPFKASEEKNLCM